MCAMVQLSRSWWWMSCEMAGFTRNQKTLRLKVWGSSYHRLYPLYFANISSFPSKFIQYSALAPGSKFCSSLVQSLRVESFHVELSRKILKVHEFSKDTIVITAAEVTARFFLRIKSVASSSYATLLIKSCWIDSSGWDFLITRR